MGFKCIICEESLSYLFPGQETRNVVSTSCGHVFHFVCISKWISIKTTQFHKFATPIDRFSIHCPYNCPDISPTSLNRLILEDEDDSSSKRTIPNLLHQGSSPASASNFSQARINCRSLNQGSNQQQLPENLTWPSIVDLRSNLDAIFKRETEMGIQPSRRQEVKVLNVTMPSPKQLSDRMARLSIWSSDCDLRRDVKANPRKLFSVDDNASDAEKSGQSARLFENQNHHHNDKNHYPWFDSTDENSNVASMPNQNLNKVDYENDNNNNSDMENKNLQLQPSHKNTNDALELENTQLKIGDQVIWSYDGHVGQIRWIGMFKFKPYAGVEFSRPIGNYIQWNSEFPNIKCKNGFGRLVRLSDLKLAPRGYAI